MIDNVSHVAIVKDCYFWASSERRESTIMVLSYSEKGPLVVLRWEQEGTWQTFCKVNLNSNVKVL